MEEALVQYSLLLRAAVMFDTMSDTRLQRCLRDEQERYTDPEPVMTITTELTRRQFHAVRQGGLALSAP